LKNTIVEVELNLIDAHPRQPRLGFSKESISNLADSLEDPDIGLLQPVVLRPKPNAPGRYELVAGERRVRAARRAAWIRIPAIIRAADDKTSLKSMIAENYEREQLNVLELGFAIAELNRPQEEGGCGMTTDEIGKMFHHKRAWVCELLRLLKLPEPWRSQLIAGELDKARTRLLVGNGRDKEFYEAVRTDQEEHPDRWRTRNQWELNVKKILNQIERHKSKADSNTRTCARSAGPEDCQPVKTLKSQPVAKTVLPGKASNGDKPADRPIDAPASSDESPSTNDSTPISVRLLTDDQVRKLVEPYAHSNPDLVAIRNQCRDCILELAVNQPRKHQCTGRTKRPRASASA
jgi:ParB/RepB/Spo0J family partition protein